jgi:hypothetical protein
MPGRYAQGLPARFKLARYFTVPLLDQIDHRLPVMRSRETSLAARIPDPLALLAALPLGVPSSFAACRSALARFGPNAIRLGDKTAIELFMAGLHGWEAAPRRRLMTTS